MTFPSDLTTKLLDFILNTHNIVHACLTHHHPIIRRGEIQTLRTGIEHILAQDLQPPTIPVPPAPPNPAAVAVTVYQIWTTVLLGFTDGAWLEQNGQLLFFARWDTEPNESTYDLLTQLITELQRT